MQTQTTDKGVGLGLLFLLLALVGAGAMFGGELAGSGVAAVGFALAVALGCLAVVAIHAYPE